MSTIHNGTSSLSAIEIILSCSICQDTLSNIYAEDDENRGLRKSNDPEDGRVTKLWLTECAHLCCAKHFERGGVPFHPDQQAPRAPCPFCAIENDDRSDKTLFYINGPANGEHDPNIPGGYFQTPPVDLGGSDPAFAALLFQYLSLIRFGAKVREKALRLGNSLRLWEERKTEIVRSLSNVAPLRDELLSAGRRLLALGQEVSSTEAVLNSAGTSLVQDPHVYQRPGAQQHLSSNLLTRDNATLPRPSLDVSSRLARGSAADLDRLTKGSPSLGHRGCGPANGLFSRDGYSAKRQRVESFSDLGRPFDLFPSSQPYAKVPSRDLMPPPPLPMRNPFVFMVNTDDPDGGNSNTGEARDEVAHERAASNTPQRQPSQESVRSSATRYTGTTQGSATRYPSSVSNASTALSETPARGGFVDRGQPVMQAQAHMNFHGPGRRPSIAEAVASQAASISEIAGSRASSASRNESVSRHISPHGPGLFSHSRVSGSSQAGTSSRHFTPSRERILGTPHRQQLGATSQTGSQYASNGTPSEENLHGRVRTPAQFPPHRRAPSEQPPGQSAEAEDENLAQRNPRHQRRRADR